MFQDDGYLSLDYQEQTGEMYWKEEARFSRRKWRSKRMNLEAGTGGLCESVREGKTPAVTGQQGADALAIALEITRQIGG